jgi:hypothetical protein
MSENDEQCRIADGLAHEEISRLKRVRKERGDFWWAGDLGSTVVTGLVFLTMTETKLTGEKILEHLEPHLKEAGRRPDLSYYFIDGIVKELERRRYFKKD